MSKSMRFLLTVLITVVPLLILFTILELSFRYVELRNKQELPRQAENATDVPIKMKSYFRGPIAGVQVSLNRYGFRDEPDLAPVPAPDEYRIFSMGDSIAFGLELRSRDSYAKVLERKLNARGGMPHYNVINASGPGTSPSSYYVVLKNEISKWHPRMVLIQIELTNDVTDEALMRWEPDPENPLRPKAVRGGRYVVSWDGIILSSFIRGPYFYEKTYTYAELSRRILNLLYRFSSVKPYPADPGACYYAMQHEWYLLNKNRLEEGWTRMFGALRATSDLLKQQKVGFLVLIMPSRYIYESDRQRSDFARELVSRAAKIAERNGIPYMDFTQCLASLGGEKVFLDTVHPNKQANEAIGQALFEQFKEGPAPQPRSAEADQNQVNRLGLHSTTR